MMLGLIRRWWEGLIFVLLKVLGAQPPPQPGSANYGVEVIGSQDATKGNIANAVRNNRVAQQSYGNAGVRVGNQKAGEGISNEVCGNVIGNQKAGEGISGNPWHVSIRKPPKTVEKPQETAEKPPKW